MPANGTAHGFSSGGTGARSAGACAAPWTRKLPSWRRGAPSPSAWNTCRRTPDALREDGGDLEEMISMLDVESYLDDQGIDYRITQGSRGKQANLQVCPV